MNMHRITVERLSLSEAIALGSRNLALASPEASDLEAYSTLEYFLQELRYDLLIREYMSGTHNNRRRSGYFNPPNTIPTSL